MSKETVLLNSCIEKANELINNGLNDESKEFTEWHNMVENVFDDLYGEKSSELLALNSLKTIQEAVIVLHFLVTKASREFRSNRPDFSDYIAHFTTDRVPCVDDKNNPTKSIAKDMSAKDRLISILRSKTIVASIVPWASQLAVCFTECPWSSLLAHSSYYSPYGIGFHKARIFAGGGGPTYYVRHDQRQVFQSKLPPFYTPFWPEYRPSWLKNGEWAKYDTLDFSHEREWRFPNKNFTFKLDQVEFVIIKSQEDLDNFPVDIKNEIGQEKFLIMDNYRHIENLWPVHRMQP